MEKRIEIIAGTSIDDAYRQICEESSRCGVVVVCDFNGHQMRSDEPLDTNYRRITGIGKDDIEKRRLEAIERYERREREHKAKIPELIKEYRQKAIGIIPDYKMSLWCEILPVRLNDLYHGMELGATLDLVSILNKKNLSVEDRLKEAKTLLYDQGHSGMSGHLVLGMCCAFHPLGRRFATYVDVKYPVTPKFILDAIKDKAEEYAESIGGSERYKQSIIEDFNRGAKFGTEDLWFEVKRDNEGFATDECLDLMFSNMPFIIYDSEEDDADVVTTDEWRGDIERHTRLSHWKPFRMPVI